MSLDSLWLGVLVGAIWVFLVADWSFVLRIKTFCCLVLFGVVWRCLFDVCLPGHCRRFLYHTSYISHDVGVWFSKPLSCLRPERSTSNISSLRWGFAGVRLPLDCWCASGCVGTVGLEGTISFRYITYLPTCNIVIKTAVPVLSIHTLVFNTVVAFGQNLARPNMIGSFMGTWKSSGLAICNDSFKDRQSHMKYSAVSLSGGQMGHGT